MSRSFSRQYRSSSALRHRHACQLLASRRPKDSRSSNWQSFHLSDRMWVSCFEAGRPLLERRTAHHRCEGSRTWHSSAWPRTRSARASSARVPEQCYRARSSRSVESVASSGSEQMPTSRTSTNMQAGNISSRRQRALTKTGTIV